MPADVAHDVLALAKRVIDEPLHDLGAFAHGAGVMRIDILDAHHDLVADVVGAARRAAVAIDVFGDDHRAPTGDVHLRAMGRDAQPLRESEHAHQVLDALADVGIRGGSGSPSMSGQTGCAACRAA